MLETPSFESIRNLLAEGKTEAAANSLFQLAKNSDKAYYTSALLLKNRLETLQHNSIEGVVSQAEERLEWARISKGIVGLVEQMELGELPQLPEDLLRTNEVEGEDDRTIATSNFKLMYWLLPLAAVVVLLFFIPKMVEKQDTKPASAQVIPPPQSKLQDMHGQLIWFDEKPVPNAVITVKGYDYEYVAQTDAKGKFTLKIRPDLINKQVEFKVQYNDKDQVEIIRLIPENIRQYTLAK